MSMARLSSIIPRYTLKLERTLTCLESCRKDGGGFEGSVLAETISIGESGD